MTKKSKKFCWISEFGRVEARDQGLVKGTFEYDEMKLPIEVSEVGWNRE